ncbi:MAG TPA: sialidase family protein [bacterium]|nr:sialidase family protein [bacterium]HQP97352.1 sialidase family protein [bacterium]
MSVLSRRQFMAHIAAGVTVTGCRAHGPAIVSKHPGIELLSKEVFIPSREKTGVFPGFITYIHKRKPVLLHRFGWVQASDTYDDFHDSISEDNGRTWTEPVLRLQGKEVQGGRIRYCENSAFFDTDTGNLITLVSKFLYPEGRFDQDVSRKIEIGVFDPLKSDSSNPFTTDFGVPGGITISFCFPIKTSIGRIVIPATCPALATDGTFLHHPKSKLLIHEVRMILAEYRPNGSLAWRIGSPLKADPEKISRGFSESTPVELRDGRLALLCRGSNYNLPDVPGYKWLSFSEDAGETWSEATPLVCTDGGTIESSATGSACFRSIKTRKIYFIGNLCETGIHADGNWPRSPLVIAEVEEPSFRLKRDTITVIDRQGPEDSERTQISNFRYYQDRENGDIVVFATRFGECDAKEWKWADYYRYRVSLA